MFNSFKSNRLRISVLGLVLFFAVTLSLSKSNAQITIGTSDMPQAGHIYNLTSPSAGATVDFSSTGANYTWDFSSLDSNTVTPDTFISNTQLPLIYIVSFLTSNLAEHANGSGVNLGLSFAMTDVYNVYKNSGSSFKQSGFAGSLQGTQIPVIYNPADEIYQFPLNYNNSFVTNSAYTFQLPTIASFSQARVRTTTVDGWGKLILPGGLMYDVIRVKSDINDMDSIYVNAAGFGFNIPRATHEYKWIAAGKGVPMLQINTNEIGGNETVSSTRYQNLYQASNSVSNISTGENNFIIYPNPASNQLTIDNGQVTMNKISIQDVLGKVVFTSKIIDPISKMNFDISALSPGVYFVQALSGTHLVSTFKLVVTR